MPQGICAGNRGKKRLTHPGARYSHALCVKMTRSPQTRHHVVVRYAPGMAFDSFREFIQQLDRAGELKRISQPVATELEITELANREMKSPDGGKALLFEQPTVNGVVSPFPVAINAMGSHKRMAL